MRSLLVVAGEASGDLLAAATVEALGPGWTAWGIGGPRLRAAGFEAVEHAEALGLIGLVEVLGAVPRVALLAARLVRMARRRRPDVVLLVDMPDFNLHLGPLLRRALGASVPIVYLGAPQAWAWRPGRARAMARWVDALACLFPFEPSFFRSHGVNATFVGHPRAAPPLSASRTSPPVWGGGGMAADPHIPSPKQGEVPSTKCEAEGAASPTSPPCGGEFGSLPGRDGSPLPAADALKSAATCSPLPTGEGLGERATLAVLPGSRRAELARHLPVLDAALPGLAALAPAHRRRLVVAPTLSREAVAAGLGREARRAVELVEGDAMEILRRTDVAWVASGTAVTECVICGAVPIVFYRVAPLTFAIARRLVRTPHIAMANLLAGERLVPELVQDELTPQRLLAETRALLDDDARREAIRARLLELGAELAGPDDGSTPAGRVAALVYSVSSSSSSGSY